MNVLKALFWVVAVSFLLAGRNGVSTSFDSGPAADYLGPEAPAVRSSEAIVDKVVAVKGICKREEEICGVVGAVAHFSLRFIDQVLSQFLPGDTYQKLDAPKVPKKKRVFENQDDNPYLDHVNELLYSVGEELDDIG